MVGIQLPVTVVRWNDFILQVEYDDFILQVLTRVNDGVELSSLQHALAVCAPAARARWELGKRVPLECFDARLVKHVPAAEQRWRVSVSVACARRCHSLVADGALPVESSRGLSSGFDAVPLWLRNRSQHLQ
jgi:hypothetical protein